MYATYAPGFQMSSLAFKKYITICNLNEIKDRRAAGRSETKWSYPKKLIWGRDVMNAFFEKKGRVNRKLSSFVQIRFNPAEPFLNILKGVGIGKPDIAFSVLTEINTGRDAHMGVF